MLNLLMPSQKASTDSSFGGVWYSNRVKTQAGVIVDEEISLSLGALWRATLVLVNAASTLPYKVYQYDADDDRKESPTNVAYDLIGCQPNPLMGSTPFWAGLTTGQVLKGNGFAKIDRDVMNRPVELWPIHPGRVKSPQTGDKLPNGQQVPLEDYLVRGADGNYTVVQAQDMLHVPGCFPEDGRWGKGVVTYHRESIGAALGMERIAGTSLGSGNVPRVALMDPALKDRQLRLNFRREWKEMHGSPDSGELAIIFNKNAQLIPLSISNADAQFLESRKFSVEEMARIVGVPLHMLKVPGTAAGNVEQMAIEFIVYDLYPWLRSQDQQCNLKLFSKPDRAKYFCEHDLRHVLRGDTTTRYNCYKTAIGIGLMSVNECRRLENMPGIGPDGDIYMCPLNMTTLKAMREGKVPAQASKPGRGGLGSDQSGAPAEDGGTTDENALAVLVPQLRRDAIETRLAALEASMCAEHRGAMLPVPVACGGVGGNPGPCPDPENKDDEKEDDAEPEEDTSAEDAKQEARDQEDADTEQDREEQDQALADAREKEDDTTQEKNDAADNALQDARDKEDQETQDQRDKEDKETGPDAFDKDTKEIESAREGKDGDRDAAREEQDGATTDKRDAEDKETDTAREKEDKDTADQRAMEDKDLDERNASDDERDAVQERRDSEDSAKEDARDKQDGARDKGREKEDAATEKERDKADAVETKGREKEDAARDVAYDKTQATQEKERDKADKDQEKSREKEDKKIESDRAKEEYERDAKREKEDKAIEKQREKEDKERDAKRKDEDKGKSTALTVIPRPVAKSPAQFTAAGTLLQSTLARLFAREVKAAQSGKAKRDFDAWLPEFYGEQEQFMAGQLEPVCAVLATLGVRADACKIASDLCRRSQEILGKQYNTATPDQFAATLADWPKGRAEQEAATIMACRCKKPVRAEKKGVKEDEPTIVVNIHNHLKDMPAPNLHVTATEVNLPPMQVTVGPTPVNVMPAAVNVEVQSAVAPVTVEARPIIHNEIIVPEAKQADDYEIEVTGRDTSTGKPTRYRRKPHRG